MLDEMQERLDAIPADSSRRPFLGTYGRTTFAIGQALDNGVFEDPEWVERWDVVFAQLYLDAHDAHLAGARVPRP